MTELELLKMRHAQINEEVTELLAEQKMIEERIQQIIEEEIVEDNPFWGATDHLLGRESKVIAALRENLMAGGREHRMYAQSVKAFNTKYVVPLADDMGDVPQDYIDYYVKEQSEHFALGIIGGLGVTGFIIDEINTDNGELEGYCMIWSGNAGPIVARQRFEAWYTQPNIGDILEGAAERLARSLDYQYRWAQMKGTVAEFMAEHPYYEVPEE